MHGSISNTLGPALRFAGPPEPAADRARPGGLGQRQADFASVMSRHGGPPAEKGDLAAAREAAADFVSAAFIEPLLKEARAASRAAPPFAPGPAEKQFQGLMDAQLARRIAGSANFPLVDRLAQDLVRAPRSLPGVPPAAEAAARAAQASLGFTGGDR